MESENCEGENTPTSTQTSTKMTDDERAIPGEINRYYSTLPVSTPYEHVNYTRVVRIDLCPTERANSGFDLTVKRFDFDFADLGLGDEITHKLAFNCFETLKDRNYEESICSGSLETLDFIETLFVMSQIEVDFLTDERFDDIVCSIIKFIKHLIKLEDDDKEIEISKADFDYYKNNHRELVFLRALLAKAIRENITVSAEELFSSRAARTTSKNSAAIQTTQVNKFFTEIYNPVPSSFDIRFRGKTAVIFRSNVRHLRFHPDAFVYTNPRDKIYYRNEFVAEDFKWCCFVNAYDSGAATNGLPCKSPFNQEHKIDLSMLLCVFQKKWKDPKTKKLGRWLFTPIKIDPPHENGGTGG